MEDGVHFSANVGYSSTTATLPLHNQEEGEEEPTEQHGEARVG